MDNSTPRSGLAMTIIGVLMLIASVFYLIQVDDPFPMWLIIGGAGLMFVGVGSATQRRGPEGSKQ